MTVDLLTRTLATQELVTEVGKDVLRVINDYAYALNALGGCPRTNFSDFRTLHIVFNMFACHYI